MKLRDVFHKALQKIIALERFADRKWYLPLMGLLAAIDLFVLFIPTAGLVVSNAWLRPKRWIRAFIWFASGSALGALLVGVVIHFFGEAWIRALLGHSLESANPSIWLKTSHMVERHGPIGLGLVAASPLPLQPAVAAAGLLHLSLLKIFISVWSGRLLQFGFLAWAATHAPHLLKKIRRLNAEVREIKQTELELQSTAQNLPRQ